MMSPNVQGNESFVEGDFLKPNADNNKTTTTKAEPRKYNIVYWNIIVFLYYHIAGLHGLYLAFASAKWPTIGLNILTFWLAGMGIIAGAHRLWSHKSYKAKKPLQLFLMICHSIANQHSVVHWARDHRLHHKYSDTDADPHNASRGFFYSHVGWLFVKKHPEVKRKGNLIDVSDLLNNPYLSFQHRHNFWFLPLIAFAIPTFIPIYYWRETFSNAWNVNMFRYVMNLNITFMINSVTHLWGNKPYDKEIGASQNRSLFYLTLGEGSHNFHHVFPWDYRSDELGFFSFMTRFIDFCAMISQAYDMKVADARTFKARAERTGDGTIH